MYELARRGIEVERQSRRIHIFSLVLDSFAKDQCSFTVSCSKGTYVRTLVEDIGRELGCGAHITELRRLTVDPYGEEVMYTFAALEAMANEHGSDYLLTSLLPIETAVHTFPAIKLSASAAFYLRTGQSVRTPFPLEATIVRLLSDNAQFFGMGEITVDGRIKPYRMLAEI